MEAAIKTVGQSLISQLIAERLPLTPVPTIREICLHKAHPNSGLARFGEADPDFNAPYWAHWWGGGLALARHVLDCPEIVKGRRVLDLGAGSGIVGIAAALSGATHVLAADVDRYAIAATALNAVANGVAIETYLGDLTSGPAPGVDVMLVGDLFYEADLAKRVAVFLERCLDAGIAVLVGDPHRAHLPLKRLSLIAEYPGPDFGATDGGTPARNAVFEFRRS